MFFNLILVILGVSSWTTGQQLKPLKTIFQWKSLQFGFPTDADRQQALASGDYKPNAGTPIDIDVEYKPTGERRVFYTIPRFTDGIPYSLATVSLHPGSGEPFLEPYPSYESHNLRNPNCHAIISASRVKIDECNHMWVMDSGVVAGVQICPPQLLTFDLKDDRLINRVQFPPFLYTAGQSLFLALAVDVLDPYPVGSCRQAKVYTADPKTNSLVVYNLERNAAVKVEDALMSPNPNWANHSIAGSTFELYVGIYSLNVSPRNSPKGVDAKERYLYFHALAEDSECTVPLRFLDIGPSPNDYNSNTWQREQPSAFQVIGRRGVQSAMEAMDRKGNLYASTNDQLSIFVWNIQNPYESNSFQVVANDPRQLEFVSGMKVIQNPSGFEELWVLANRFQRFVTGTVDYNEVNFVTSMCLTDILLEYGECKGFDTTDFINPRA